MSKDLFGTTCGTLELRGHELRIATSSTVHKCMHSVVTNHSRSAVVSLSEENTSQPPDYYRLGRSCVSFFWLLNRRLLMKCMAPNSFDLYWQERLATANLLQNTFLPSEVKTKLCTICTFFVDRKQTSNNFTMTTLVIAEWHQNTMPQWL